MKKKAFALVLVLSLTTSFLATTALACVHYDVGEVNFNELVVEWLAPGNDIPGYRKLSCPICGEIVFSEEIPPLTPNDDPLPPDRPDDPGDPERPPRPDDGKQAEKAEAVEEKQPETPIPTDPQRPEESRAEEPKPYEAPAMRTHQTISGSVAHGRISIEIDGTEYHGLHINGVQFLGWSTDGPGGLRVDHVHTLQLVARTATCTEAGMSEYVICSECKESCFPRQGPIEISALGHDYGGWTDEQGNCQTASSRFRTCSRCGHEDRQTLGKGEHHWAAIGENYEDEVGGFVVWGHYEECSVCHEQRQVEEGREILMVEDPLAY